MNDSSYFIGHSDFHDQTTVHPAGLAMLILLGIAMLLLPRNRAMLALVACASFMAVGQRIVIASLDFNFIKLFLLFGWARILVRGELEGFRWHRMDTWFVIWATVAMILYPISHGASGIVYKLGANFEALGTYFLVRVLVRDLSDVRSFIDCVALTAIPVACVIGYEFNTHYNLFSILGGVPEITLLREGKFRCQGAYSHPILAGCFWAVLMPLLISRLFSPGRWLAVLAVPAALVIIAACASSTPVLGLIAAAFGFALFYIRRWMLLVRVGAVLTLCFLHAIMKAPVWHLVCRTDVIGGSTGYHRFVVIDQFIKHFREWALCGVAYIDHWLIFANDVTNQYALEGIRGGGPTLICFLVMISVAFGNVGRMWRAAPSRFSDLILCWSIGVSLWVHCVNFIGVSYWGQIDVLWYTGLALTTVQVGKGAQPRSAPAAPVVRARSLRRRVLRRTSPQPMS